MTAPVSQRSAFSSSSRGAAIFCAASTAVAKTMHGFSVKSAARPSIRPRKASVPMCVTEKSAYSTTGNEKIGSSGAKKRKSSSQRIAAFRSGTRITAGRADKNAAATQAFAAPSAPYTKTEPDRFASFISRTQADRFIVSENSIVLPNFCHQTDVLLSIQFVNTRFDGNAAARKIRRQFRERHQHKSPLPEKRMRDRQSIRPKRNRISP